MTWPPAILSVRVVRKDRRKLRLCLPLFLLWPVGLLLALALLPVLLIPAAILCRSRKAGSVLAAPPRLLAAACALRGLRVDMTGPDDRVHVSFL